MRFELTPFGKSAIDISGSITLLADVIECSWTVSGPLDEIAWPRPVTPHRTMNLWDHTCFEFFIGPVSESVYCEFNLSPSGQWNSFLFDDVREQMREAQSVERLESAIDETATGHRTIATTVRFDAWLNHHEFRVGVSSVIELSGGTMQYFALRHPGARPDFHARAGHQLRLTRKDE